MMQLADARALMTDLMKKVGISTATYRRRESCLVPRPPFFASFTEWKGHNLHNPMKVQLREDLSPKDWEELFGEYVDLYIAFKEGEEHPFSFIKKRFEIDRRDHQNLFPSRRRIDEFDVMYGLAVILFCAYSSGHQVLYGKDWALAIVGDVVFGVDDHKTVAKYPALCVDVPKVNWKSMFEDYREPGKITSTTLSSLYTRSGNKRFPDVEQRKLSTSTVLWTAINEEKRLDAQCLYSDVTSSSVEDYIAGKVLDAQDFDKLRTFKSLMVPTLVTGAMFDAEMADKQIAIMFMNREQIRQLVRDIRAAYDI